MSANDVYVQTNQNMLQQPPFGFNFQMIPVAPYKTEQGYGLNVTRPLDFVPTLAPIRNGTMSTTVETYNEMNLNPRTYIGGNALGNLPQGMARGETSLFANPAMNPVGRLLTVNNNDMFKQVALDKRMVKIRPSSL